VKTAKIMVAPRKWRGFIMYMPTKPRREEDILSELKGMKTLELGRPLTSEEVAVVEKAAKRRRRVHLQQRIVTWLGEPPKVRYRWVRILEPIEPFIAEDRKRYGPYKPGEIVKIPSIDAERLIRRKEVSLL